MDTENKDKDVVRLVLEGDAKLAHDKMTEVLKAENQFIKLTPSRFGNWIFKRYMAAYFEQDKALIINDHFDSKEHLKDALRTASTPQELEKALEEALQRVKGGSIEIKEPRKRRGRPPRQVENNITEPQDNLLE